MKRLGQWLFNLAAGVSGLLFALTVALRVGLLSPWHIGWGDGHRAKGYYVYCDGGLSLESARGLRNISLPNGNFSVGGTVEYSFDFAGIYYFRSTDRAFGSNQLALPTIYGYREQYGVSAAWLIVLFAVFPAVWLIRGFRIGGRLFSSPVSAASVATTSAPRPIVAPNAALFLQAPRI